MRKIVLSIAMFSGGFNSVAAAERNVMDVWRGICLAVDTAVAHLKIRAKVICTTKEVAKVGASPANGERETGDLIAWAMEKVGRRRVTTVSSKPIAPEFKHSMTRSALWVDGCSTPAGVKAELKLIANGSLQSRANYGTRDLAHATAQGKGTVSAAIAVLKTGRKQGTPIDLFSYVEALQLCLKQQDVKAAKQVHDYILESGMDKNIFVANTLMNVFIKCGELLEARRVFDKLNRKNVVTWNSMIAGYAKSGLVTSALELFKSMPQEGVQPDKVTYVCVLKACATRSDLQWGKEAHACIRQAGFESDVRVGTALLQMYAKCGCITEARRVFGRMQKRDLVIWNTMIGVLAKHGCEQEAYQMFCEMRREGFQPDAYTYANIFNSCASAGALEWVKVVHAYASKSGLETDLRVGNALIHIYARKGSISDARMVFDRMKKRTVVTWTAMIGGLGQHGRGHEALELFREMNANHVTPNETTFVAVLSACCHSGLVDDGRRLFLAMTKDYGIKPTVVHCTCMVDLLGRAGHLEEAKLFISNMPIEPNVVTWSALLGASRTYGNVKLGELAAEEVFKLEPQNAFAYVLLSNIYAAAGKWEKVSWVRTMMQERGVRKEAGRSRIEVGGKVHDFIAGDTCHPEIDSIEVYLKKLTEMLKAEGYIPDTQLVLQNVDEENKELALCSHSERLAIAYGLMRIPPGEPILVQKNLRVCPDCHTAIKLMSRVTGREIIARDASRFHHFKDGLCSCGEFW